MNSIFSTLLMLILYITPNTSTVPPTMCPFNDTTPPEITCPDPIYLEFEAYEQYPQSNIGCRNTEGGPVSVKYDGITRVGQQGNWSETDIWNPLNCSQEILYKDLRSWTCFDKCKNEDQCYEEIIIRDTTNPVITCPDTKFVEFREHLDVSRHLTPELMGKATCKDSTLTNITKINDIINTTNKCGETFDVVREWACTDACGKSDACNQTIVVQDTTGPYMQCHDSLDKGTDLTEGLFYPWVKYNKYNNNPSTIYKEPHICLGTILPPIDTVEYHDTCLNFTKEVAVVHRTFKCIDSCGNFATKSHSSCYDRLLLYDNVAPVIRCNDISIECGADTQNLSITGIAICTDNYDTNPIISYTVIHNSTDESISTTLIIRRFKCTDSCSNSATCDQYIVEKCPTSAPTEAPSVAPSLSPTQSPSFAPTLSPSLTPSLVPTQPPSLAPSNTPTLPPSIAPSNTPTQSPSLTPSNTPSLLPSIAPSQIPSNAPTISPTLSPTLSPSISPSLSPTSPPSISPSLTPTQPPSISPSIS
eukprot:518356_1